MGTIALPGSQPDSELPINPLALSLNLGIVHRPPAQLSPAATTPSAATSSAASTSVTATQASSTLQRNVAGPSVASKKSLSRSATPISRPVAKSSKKRSRPSSRATSDEPPPGPREPEFTLPDPSAPLPSHFLRNQENLLGKAGVVAGVKPSTLTHSRGSTPSNPIVVEEEDDTPKLGRRSGLGFVRPYIDPSLLTAPSNQEIVQVLIGQKDIFPILEGVLKLVVGNAAASVGPRPTAFQSKGTSRQSTPTETTSSASENPPLKRRKLNRVPAGAADWDVPYPFKDGEGPEAYEKTWERERGKQLISQLIQQIKIAARKAATKKYLQQQQEKQLAEELERRRKAGQLDSASTTPSKYYRPETATYGLSEQEKNKQVYGVLQDASNASWLSAKPTTIGHTPSPRQELSGTPRPSPASSNVDAERQQSMTPSSTFQQLTNSYIASMQGTALQAQQGNQDTTESSPSSTDTLVASSPDPAVSFPNASTQAVTSAPVSSALPSTLDQASFDSWMNLFLQSMPPSSFDFTSTQLGDLSGISSMATSAFASQCSTPAHPESSNFDMFPLLDIQGATSTSSDLPLSSVPSSATSDLNTDMNVDANTVFSTGFSHPHPVPAASSDVFDANFNFDFGNLDFSSLDMSSMPNSDQNSNLDLEMLSMQDASSPHPSTSSFTGTSVTDPATPASATWDISLPDIQGSHSGSHHGGGGSSIGDVGQGMWSDGLWDFNGTDAHAGSLPLVGWEAALSMPVESFGVLPELHESVPKTVEMPQVGTFGARLEPGHSRVDKGKGRATDALQATHQTISSSVTPKEFAFQALMGTPLDTAIQSLCTSPSTSTNSWASTPAFSLPFSKTTISASSLNPSTSTTPALSTPQELRKRRKADILRRAKEKRKRMQEELDEVKNQLWATTVEQAGLLLMLRKIEEDEIRQRASVSTS